MMLRAFALCSVLGLAGCGESVDCVRATTSLESINGIQIRVEVEPTGEGRTWFVKCRILVPSEASFAKWSAIEYDLEFEELDEKARMWKMISAENVRGPNLPVVPANGPQLSWTRRTTVSESHFRRVRYTQEFENDRTREARRLSTPWLEVR